MGIKRKTKNRSNKRGMFQNRGSKGASGDLQHITYQGPFLRPEDYAYSERYQAFHNQAETRFRNTIVKCSADDLCGDMFDAQIDAVVQQMREDADMQYREHCTVIEDARRITCGNLACEVSGLEDLRCDLAKIDLEIAKYEAMQESWNQT